MLLSFSPLSPVRWGQRTLQFHELSFVFPGALGTAHATTEDSARYN
jgi:hypothetical protein